MIKPELLSDILNQPASLARSFEYQLGPGRPSLTASAQAILQARMVVLSGMGSSHFAAIPLSYHLAAHGIAAFAMEASELLHYLHPGSAGAAVVLVSRSGETVEVTKLIPILKANGVPIIGVTNVAESTLARESDHTILVHSLADQAVAIQTYTATLSVLLAVGSAAAGREGWTGPDPSLIGDTIQECLRESEGWREFLRPSTALYLLGRGPAMAAVAEGGLLFHEVAKAPVLGLSAGFFRHGPVEVVDESFRGIVFAADPVTRDLNLALAANLAGYGGQVAVVGPEAVPGCLHWRIPETDPLLFPLFEILPVQVAAYRLAEWRGIATGEFRIASAVTLDEAGFAGNGK